jgi:hypothetical protein
LLSTWLVGCDRGTYSYEDASGASSGGNAGSGGVAGGVSGLGGTATAAGSIGIALPTPPCQVVETGAAVFAGRAFSNDAPARRELYTWTTSEQVQELRAGSVLLTRTEREGLGPGYAMTVLDELAHQVSEIPAEKDLIALAGLLSGPSFGKARYAWPEPWATRVGWPGESYGDQLVRIVLRQDAWLARYQSGSIDVFDMNNAPVTRADALAHPERLAGVYFVRDVGAGGPRCFGSFRGGDDGYREFIIGNEAMIEEWSLGTPDIRARIESDLTLVQAFFERIRPCPHDGDAHNWNLSVVCAWFEPPTTTELGAYQGALAIPSPSYLPQAMPLANLIEALRESLFEPDPFVVKPGQ